jgi:hypothetical protein
MVLDGGCPWCPTCANGPHCLQQGRHHAPLCLGILLRQVLPGHESRARGEYALIGVLRDDSVRESADDGCGAV